MCETVSFDLAKKLKEKGFNHKTRCGFLPPIKFVHEAFTDTDWCAKNGYPAPTISQVLKWLREEKRIEVNACWDNFDAKWIGYASEMEKPDLVGYYTSIDYDSYEEAAIASINWTLDNLI